MDPGQEKNQQGGQLEGHSVVLPADGSPILEEHPDDGKDLGKVRSNVSPETVVSGDYGEESSCSSPPQSVYCTTSSSQDDCASSYSGSYTSNYSEDETGNEWTSSSNGSSTTSCSPTVDRPYAELQLLEVLPPNFKYIEMAKKFQEGISQLRSPEPSHGLDKREDPILSPDDSSISQRHQVGLVGDVARLTSVTGINRKRTKDSDSEEEPPAKKTRDTVAEEELPFKRTRDSVAEEELPSKRTREHDDAEEEPSAKRSRNSDDEEEPVLSPSTNTLCEDSVLSSPVFSPLPRTPCEGPILSIHAISPPLSEDPVFSSPVLSSPHRTACEDPIVSSPVDSPSPSTYCKIPSLSFPCICVWMKSHTDREEEPIPSTSGIGSDVIRERESSRRMWFRPHYDWTSDDSD